MSDYDPISPRRAQDEPPDDQPGERAVAPDVGHDTSGRDDGDDTPSTSPRPRRPLRRIFVTSGVIIVAIVFVAAIILLALTDEHPAWWRSVNIGDQTTIEAAEIVENHLISVASRVRDMDETSGSSEEWGISVLPDQANAWLNTRLRDWVANQERGQELFRHILEVQVDFGPDRFIVGAKIQHRGNKKVFSATLVPQLRDDGSLWLIADRVHVGRLSLPGWILTDLIDQSDAQTTPVRQPEGAGPVARADATTNDAPPPDASADVPPSGGFDIRSAPEAREMFAAFAGRQPVIREPIIRLPDGRRVRLVGLDTRSGNRLVVMCRTELRQGERARFADAALPSAPE